MREAVVGAIVDGVVIALWYVGAVLLRVGGRLETADIEQAVPSAVVAAALQVAGNVAVGSYRRGWPRETRSLFLLGIPALAVGVLAAAFNLVSAEHPIPNAAIPPAVVFSAVSVAALHVRPRWTAIGAVIAGRRAQLPEALPIAGEPHLDQLFLASDSPIRTAIRVIDSDVSRIALVVDSERRLLGVITDGDVRRAILAGVELSAPVTSAMTSDPVVAQTGASDEGVLELMRRHSVRQVPLVDEQHRVTDIRLLDGLGSEPETLCSVIIMAGGIGSRLGSLTKDRPKPLVRVGGRPILEMLIRDLSNQGFRRIFLAVNYRADQIESYFGDGAAFGADISYLREETPLGTAGAIRLARADIDGSFIVTNADLLTRVNFRQLLGFHRRNQNDMTIGVIESTLQLRYGLVETAGTRVTAIREKPALRHFINAGIYVLEPRLTHLVPPNERFDMDELISAALRDGEVVGCFPIHEYWTDIGDPVDLARASDEIADVSIRPGQIR